MLTDTASPTPESLAEAREAFRLLGETIADIGELQPHVRTRYVADFVERMMITLGDCYVDLFGEKDERD